VTQAVDASVVVLVEGASDRIALEVLAERRGRDLRGEHVVILPMGGAHALPQYLARFGPMGSGPRLRGLCDAAEEHVFRRGLHSAGIGSAHDRAQMESLGFFVCVEDLEDEMINGLGPAAVEALLDSQGDLGAFRSLQNQPQWRHRAVEAQLRRFFGSGARRKHRYARVLMQSIDLDRVPRPLDAAIAPA
jgi:hypothetical protein